MKKNFGTMCLWLADFFATCPAAEMVLRVLAAFCGQRGGAESAAAFERRVLARIGQKFSSLPKGSEEDVIGGHIMCRRGRTFVVATDVPEVDDEGNEFYAEFVRVDL